MTALKATEQASLLGTFVPPGVVMPFAGTAAPSGWLLCDGTEYSQTGTYAALFAAIGSNWNTQKKQSDNTSYTTTGCNFRVPDLRGIFLRGVGTIWQGDSPSLAGWQENKTHKTTLATTGGSVTAGGGHDHTVRQSATGRIIAAQAGSSGSPAPYDGQLGSGLDNSGTWQSYVPSIADHPHGFTNPSVSGGDNETRPHNKAVNYIIKY
jgi:microcystin-dependent protein